MDDRDYECWCPNDGQARVIQPPRSGPLRVLVIDIERG